MRGFVSQFSIHKLRKVLTDQRRHSDVIDFIKVYALMTVILIHSNFIDDVPEAELSSAQLFSDALDFLQRNIFSLAVPIFYFLSGYLFFRDGIPSTSGYLLKWRRRIRSLLIPYLLWNLLGLLLLLLKKTSLLEQHFPQYSTFSPDIATLLEGFWILPVEGAVGPYDFVLWFIRNLIIITILAPVAGYLFRYLRVFGIVVIAAIAWWWNFNYYSIASGLMFFSIGAMFPALNINLRKVTGKLLPLLLIWAGCVAAGYFVVRIETEAAATVAGLFFITALCRKLVEKNFSVLALLSESLFFIYAFHGLYATTMRSVMIHLVNPDGNLRATVCYLLIFAVDILVGLSVYILLHRFFPRALTLLSGGRQ